MRTREYLTEAKVERLMEATKDNRYGHRDATMILVAYRHGLRASEVVDLRWDQIGVSGRIDQGAGILFNLKPNGPRRKALPKISSPFLILAQFYFRVIEELFCVNCPRL